VAAEWPTGLTTFLFTDVEGSTRLWQRYRDAMGRALARHDALIEQVVARRSGMLVRPRGEGDSRFAVFARASDAVAAASDIQTAMLREPWPLPVPLRVRVGVHTGEADLRAGDYYGPAVNHCARLRAAAHGGQVLVSGVTADLVREALAAGLTLRDLGEYQLKDLERPEHVWQLVHPQLPADFPPLTLVARRRHNLPQQLNSFVGRDDALATLLVSLSRTRLLTLTGSGGIGKTRLALRLAAELSDEYADGVWLVRLESVTDPELVPAHVASALSIRERPGQLLRETLAAALGNRQLLLVLDNCEHLAEACADLAEALLSGCPFVRILATSREALRIPGELLWRVAPLQLPAAPARDSVESQQCEAVRLFVDRASERSPDFRLTERNAPVIGRICHRLDGLPLAIELAAARVNVLAPEQIEARLDDCLRLPSSGRRSGVARQQTLPSTFDWSYALLSGDERRVFERLSVFAGQIELEAAEAVCSAPPVGKAQVLGHLAELVDKSLLLRETGERDARYRMLQTVRQYACERLLQRGEVDSLRQGLAEWYAEMMDVVVRDLRADTRSSGRKAGQGTWLARLEQDQANLRAALDWSIENKQTETALRLGAGLSRFWLYHGHLSEGCGWLTQILALAGDSHPPHADATPYMDCLFNLGMLAREHGDLATARRTFERILELGAPPTARFVTCGAHIQLGRLALLEGDLAFARAMYQRAIEIVGRANDWMVANAVSGLADVAMREGDIPSARQLGEESLSIYRRVGDDVQTAYSLQHLASMDISEGQLDAARARLREALTISQSVADPVGLARGLVRCGSLALAERRPERALRLFGAASTYCDAAELGFIRQTMALDKRISAAYEMMDGAAADAARLAGQALGLDQAVEEVLRD
jgi:predicted ATPase/class 3 adenylate cyclase